MLLPHSYYQILGNSNILLGNHAASWDPNQSSGGIPQLKGARNFSFEELRKYTSNFSEVNNIGSGGYGMVRTF